MSAQRQVDNLNAAIKRQGETITLKRGLTELTVKALVRGKGADTLVGTVTANEWLLTLSPTGLAALGTPRANDTVVIKGRQCRIDSAYPIHIDDTLVRIDATAAG